ncbi:lipopolysaccharide export system permease protein [Alkalispirochaeta americana]|uniref:Lipopolysaccharide export system permease protein n=1 Tax=Alkalispirochaeta americana TaxID=159291 RepID=A0A1N6P7Z8_9SPIO|nr:LptF/LptG family permease [Alkalispirochaeta americana]SIQ00491.1 lipopolysaccharide export system permease protein [Alkalispirochaeta americana]
MTLPRRGVPALVFRYIGGEFFISFLVCFAFFFFIFFVNQLLLLAEDILQKDVPLTDVALLILYSLPSIIAISVPFATLVGVLMTVGRLSTDNEMVAFQASGFSLVRIFFPILVASLVLSGLSFGVNDFLLPRGTRNFARLYRDLLYSNPALELEPFSVKRYQNDTLITGAVFPGRIENFVILDTDGQGFRRVITAAEARLVREGDLNSIGLELTDVVTHSTEGGIRHNYSFAETLRYNILLEDITVAIRAPGPREMSARTVAEEIRKKQDALEPRIKEWQKEIALESHELGLLALDQNLRHPDAPPVDRASLNRQARSVLRRIERKPHDRSLQIHRLEYYKKFSIPFASVSFVFLAFPLGLFSKRSGRSVGFGIGLLIATGYWALLIAGQTFGSQRPEVSPLLAMWLPNGLFFVIGAVLFFRRMNR